MKINKDLTDAVMMLSFILLVLVGTSDFESAVTKNVMMGGLALVSVIMIAFRFVQGRNANDNELQHNH